MRMKRKAIILGGYLTQFIKNILNIFNNAKA
jgi:hypothetical protein